MGDYLYSFLPVLVLLQILMEILLRAVFQILRTLPGMELARHETNPHTAMPPNSSPIKILLVGLKASYPCNEIYYSDHQALRRTE